MGERDLSAKRSEPARARAIAPALVYELINTPLACDGRLLAQLAAVVDGASAGQAIVARQGFEYTSSAMDDRAGVESAGQHIAHISLIGGVQFRPGLLEQIFGIGSSVDGLRQQLRRAKADNRVGRILLEVDSPGGTVTGVPELADEINQIARIKPVTAVANAAAHSAAYWLGSAATELSVTPSGSVGSIGVFALHRDMSRMYRRAGVDVSVISAGRYKAEGSPFGPLSDEAREFAQAQIDDTYNQFVDDVARFRGTTPAQVQAKFGQGRPVRAKSAQAAGMVDRIETVDQAYSRLLGMMSASSRARRSRVL